MSLHTEEVDLLDPHQSASEPIAVWAGPSDPQTPSAQAISHSLAVKLDAPTRLDRLGTRLGRGYMKCGSTQHQEVDWITELSVLIWEADRWREIVRRDDLARPTDPDDINWTSLGGVAASDALIRIHRSGIDGAWPSWNLVSTALLLLHSATATAQPVFHRLQATVAGLDSLPRGVEARHLPGEVRYRTRFYEVGFRLGRAGFAYLALDDEGRGRTTHDLLKHASPLATAVSRRCYLGQGIRLREVGRAPALGFAEHDARGTCSIDGHVVTYDVTTDQSGQRYQLRWEMHEDRMLLTAVRTGLRPIRAWDSSAWHMAFDSAVAATTSLGRITAVGQTGIMRMPVLLHAPGFGTLRFESKSPDVLWRSDSIRPLFTTTAELKLGEIPQLEGDYLLPEGQYRAELELAITQHSPSISSDAPQSVARALRRCSLSALPFRADTATFSNNGNSIHAPICMDTWASLSIGVGQLLPGIAADEFLRLSLERWLCEAPGYGCGRSSVHPHRLEDEYLMTGAAALLALAEFLAHQRDPAWGERFAGAIARELDRMRARDIDGDGLIESPHRRGVSGEHQWSTGWYDVISFGWKDAFSNVLLYSALKILARELPHLGLADWQKQLRTSFSEAFFNPSTGWFGGWRCKQGQLHDHAFLFVNGAAVVAGLVDDSLAKQVMSRLYDELLRTGLTDFRLGLPGNLWPIPNADLAPVQHSLPFGGYQNGALTHSQSRHFVAALYRVGMKDQADAILGDLCQSLGDATAFGGCGSGVDWRSWDSSPSGYEGILSDQFGILAVALAQYALSNRQSVL